MTRRPEVMELMYWMSNPDWYTHNDYGPYRGYQIKPDAPERAKKSFEKWKKNWE